MDDDIEPRVIALARRYNGVYLFNNEKKQRLLTPTTDLDTDMRLDYVVQSGLTDCNPAQEMAEAVASSNPVHQHLN